MSGICGDCDGIKNDFRDADDNDVSDQPQDMYRLIGDSHKKSEWDLKFYQKIAVSVDYAEQFKSTMANYLITFLSMKNNTYARLCDTYAMTLVLKIKCCQKLPVM